MRAALSKHGSLLAGDGACVRSALVAVLSHSATKVGSILLRAVGEVTVAVIDAAGAAALGLVDEAAVLAAALSRGNAGADGEEDNRGKLDHFD